MNRDLLCGSTGGNTGMPPCGVIPGRIVGTYFSRERMTLIKEDLADLTVTLKQKVADVDLNKRLYPIIGINNSEDTSEDPTISTSDYGYAEKTAPGSVQFGLMYRADLCRVKQLMKWDGFNGYAFLVDDNGFFWGKRGEDGSLSSISVKNVIPNIRLFKTSADFTWNTMTINFGAPNLFYNGLDAEKYSFDIEDVVGIKDLVLQKVDTATFSAELTCGGGSIYNQFKTAIAQASAWTATNAVTGASIPIASVAENDGLQGYDLTFTTPPVIGTKVTITLNLTGLAGIDGYEAQPLTFTA